MDRCSEWVGACCCELLNSELHLSICNQIHLQTHCKYKHTANTNTVQIQYKYKHTTNTNKLQIQIQFIQTQYKQIQTQTQTHMKTNKKLIHLYTRTKFGLPVAYSVQCSVHFTNLQWAVHWMLSWGSCQLPLHLLPIQQPLNKLSLLLLLTTQI